MQKGPNASDFKAHLDSVHQWPAPYMFKFIVPKDKVEDIENLFPVNSTTRKPSKKGNYISVTAKILMDSSEEVIAIYQKAKNVEGVIAL